jgi:hypothetical protein
MIPVTAAPPPPNYEYRVRQPGEQFLAQVPAPSNTQFRQYNYWSRVHTDLYAAHSGICAYCASWIPRATNPAANYHSSVDHFLPKSQFPKLAYDWTNFRLARKDINENKGEDCEIIDPFQIQDTWFELDFYSYRIKASAQTHAILQRRIKYTIQVLRLNESPFIDERTSVIGDYAHERMSFADLEHLYPFIAKEVKRQSFDKIFKEDTKAVNP